MTAALTPEQKYLAAVEKLNTLAKLIAEREAEREAKLRDSECEKIMAMSEQPTSQPVDPVHVINTAIAVMRRDATIAGVLFDFMGWLTTRKERLCLSSADDASPAVTAITDFAKMRSLSLDNAMVTDWQSGAAQASKPLSDEPNMFWNHDDPESPYGSIGEFLNDEWCQTGLAVGDIRRVQRAIRLPDVMVRVTAVSDDGDIDYIVEPVGGIKERR